MRRRIGLWAIAGVVLLGWAVKSPAADQSATVPLKPHAAPFDNSLAVQAGETATWSLQPEDTNQFTIKSSDFDGNPGSIWAPGGKSATSHVYKAKPLPTTPEDQLTAAIAGQLVRKPGGGGGGQPEDLSFRGKLKVAVGIAKIIEDGSDPEISDIAYVRLGEQINLRAKPLPSGAGWPVNSPVWNVVSPDGGTANLGHGEVVAFRPSKVGNYVVKAACGRSEKSIVVKTFDIKFVTPASSGDPKRKPVSKGDGQNEFTYSSDIPGILTISLKVSVLPDGIASEIADKVTFDVDPIEHSIMCWDDANQGGKSKALGNNLLATVKFNGLPYSNMSFGSKSAKVKYKNKEIEASLYEVFYPKTANNHPHGIANGEWPNWMFYWMQTVTPLGPPDTINWHYRKGESSEAVFGTADIYLNDEASGGYNPPYGTHGVLGGIDTFAWTVRHESQHYADFCELWNNNKAKWQAAIGINGPDDDKDGDLIPNKVEDVNQNGNYDNGIDLYDWQKALTPFQGRSFSTVNDFEDWNAQRNKDVVGDHSKDWADPGMQHGNLDSPID